MKRANDCIQQGRFGRCCTNAYRSLAGAASGLATGLARARQAVAVAGLCSVCVFATTGAAVAVDPLYQPKLQRLSEILGALYFLRPLCGDDDGGQWRTYMEELIVQEQPDEERRARIVGSFNQGYNGYARLYLNCTPSARVATQRYLAEGEEIAKEIHTRYTE